MPTFQRANPHTAEKPVFVRAEGSGALQGLRQDARDTIRYFELVALLKEFHPLEPLKGVSLGARGWYTLCVTDWSIFLLNYTGASKAKVVLEVPLLTIKDLDVDYTDSDVYLNEIPKRPRKLAIVTIRPFVDATKVPPPLKAKLQRVQGVLDAGGSHAAEFAAAEGKHTTATAAAKAPPQQPPQPFPNWGPQQAQHASQAQHDNHLQYGQQQYQQYQQFQQQVSNQQPASQAQLYGGPSLQHGQHQAGMQQYGPQHYFQRPPPNTSPQGIQQQYGQQQPFQPFAQHPTSQGHQHQHHHDQMQTQTQAQAQPWSSQAYPRQGPGPVGESMEGSPSNPVALPSHHTYNQQQPTCPTWTPYQQPPSNYVPGVTLYNPPLFPSPNTQPDPALPPGVPLSPARKVRAPTHPAPSAPTHPHPPTHPDPSHAAAYAYTSLTSHPTASPAAPWAQGGGGGGGGGGDRGEGIPLPKTPPPTVVRKLPPPPPLVLRSPVLDPVEQPGCGEEWRPQAAPMEGEDYVLGEYKLEVMSMEKDSVLWFHVRRAWLGAHARYTLAATGTAGTPLWYVPPNLCMPEPLPLSPSNTLGQWRAGVVGAEGPAPPTPRGPVLLSSLPPQVAARAVLGHLGYIRNGRVDPEALYPWDKPLLHGSSASVTPPSRPSPHPATTAPGQLHPHPYSAGAAAQGYHTTASYGVAHPGPYSMQVHPSSHVNAGTDPYAPPSRGASRAGVREVEAEAVAEVRAAARNVSDLVAMSCERGDQRSVQEVCDEVEARMSWGCSLFDDQDVTLIKNLILEMRTAHPTKARMYATHFFSSPIIAVFCLQRLYAWGAVCALFAPAPDADCAPPHSPPPRLRPHPSSPHGRFRTPSQAWSPHTSPPLPPRPATSPHTLWGQVPSAPGHAGERGAHVFPAAPVHHSQGSAGAGAARTQLSPYVSWVMNRGRDLGDEWGEEPPASPVTSPRPPPSPWTRAQNTGGRVSSHLPVWERGGPQGPDSPTQARLGAIADVLARGQVSNVLRRRELQDNDPHSPSSPRSHTTPDEPRAGGGSRGGDQSAAGEAAGGGQSRSPFANLTIIPPGEGSEPGLTSPGGTYLGGGGGGGGRARDWRFAPPSARGGPPTHRRAIMDPDKLLGAKKLSDEEGFELHLALYNLRAWSRWWGGAGGGGGGGATPLHARRLLNRLGLSPHHATSINATLAVVMELVEGDRRSPGIDGLFGGRSKPPAVPAPPTLAPEPLCLSPLDEQPYMFVLGGKPLQGDAQGAQLPAVDADATEGAAGALRRQQARLQGATVGSHLRSGFLADYVGASPGSYDPDLQPAAVKRWERLVGRVCAALAWRKTQALAHWVGLMLEHTEGVPGRDAWFSDTVVEQDDVIGDEEGEEETQEGFGVTGRGTWTYERCMKHLVALLVQIRDPRGGTPEHRRASAPPPRAAPGIDGDPLWWARTEAAGAAGASALDAVALVVWGVWQVGQEAAARGTWPPSSSFAVAAVMQKLPPAVVHTFCRRLLCRATHLLAAHAPDGVSLQAADVHAYRQCELLHHLLGAVPQATYAVHDALGSHLSHTLRTPQVKAALAARVSRPPSGQEAAHLGNPDALLPRLAVDIYGRVVDRVVGADMGARPSVMHTPGIPQACVHGLASAGHFKMPSCTT